MRRTASTTSATQPVAFDAVTNPDGLTLDDVEAWISKVKAAGVPGGSLLLADTSNREPARGVSAYRTFTITTSFPGTGRG